MQRKPTHSSLATVLAVAATVAACATFGGEPQPAYATLVIENSSPLTVNVYALVNTVEYRLGTLAGLQTEEFEIREHMLRADNVLRVRAEPLGQYRPYYSEPLPVSEGDVIELEISEFIR